MTRTERLIRIVLILAGLVLLSSVLHRVYAAPVAPVAVTSAAADDCDQDDQYATCEYLLVYRPGMCAYLTPWTYWWGFWGCENQSGLMSEAVVVTEGNGQRTTHIERVHQDGSSQRLVLRQPLRRR